MAIRREGSNPAGETIRRAVPATPVGPSIARVPLHASQLSPCCIPLGIAIGGGALRAGDAVAPRSPVGCVGVGIGLAGEAVRDPVDDVTDRGLDDGAVSEALVTHINAFCPMLHMWASRAQVSREGSVVSSTPWTRSTGAVPVTLKKMGSFEASRMANEKFSEVVLNT